MREVTLSGPYDSIDVGGCNGCNDHVGPSASIPHKVWMISARGASLRLCAACRDTLASLMVPPSTTLEAVYCVTPVCKDGERVRPLEAVASRGVAEAEANRRDALACKGLLSIVRFEVEAIRILHPENP